MNNLIYFLTPRNVREKIIVILSTEFPLSIKQLKIRIKKYYNIEVSYQAIYKELKNLTKDDIVKQEVKSFLLNINWINKTKKFSDDLFMNYSKKYSLNIFQKLKNEGDLISLEFTSISELDNFFIGVMDYFHRTIGENGKIIMHYKHNWWPLLYADKEYKITTNDPRNTRFYCLCGSNTKLDRWACIYENKLNMNVKIIKGIANYSDFQIYNDIVIQIYFDGKIMKELDIFFKKILSIENLDIKRLIEILNLPTKIKVLIYKNKIVAEKLRGETLEYFQK